MRIAIGVGGEVIGAPMTPQDIVDEVTTAEADGFGAAWSVHFSRGVDALDILAVAGTRTSRIDLGVGIVPTYPRHPLALAQQAATTQALGGRLTLGVGVSHRPVIEGLHGIPYTRPAAHMRDYLSVLVPLLRDGSVRHRGEFYQVDGGFVVPGTSPVPVLVGALSPLMVQAAGELADGVVTWLAGPRSLGEHIVPRLLAAAAGRPAPRVVAALPWPPAPTPAGPQRRRRDLHPVRGDGQLPQAAGARGRAVARRGRPHRPGRRDREAAGPLAGVGVTELWPIIFPVGDDPGASRQRTRELLAGLAAAGPA